jgi:hypothetical protein
MSIVPKPGKLHVRSKDEWSSGGESDGSQGSADESDQSDTGDGDYQEFEDALPHSDGYQHEPVFPAPNARNLAALIDKGGFVIMRKFGGSRIEPGYPNAGWMSGDVSNAKPTDKRFNCQVEYDMADEDLTDQKLVPREYLKESTECDKDGLAPLGAWVIVRARS